MITGCIGCGNGCLASQPVPLLLLLLLLRLSSSSSSCAVRVQQGPGALRWAGPAWPAVSDRGGLTLQPSTPFNPTGDGAGSRCRIIDATRQTPPPCDDGRRLQRRACSGWHRELGSEDTSSDGGTNGVGGRVDAGRPG
eukprot:COSAG01_NODE_3399_length_6142_cov_11.969236_4_plen_138_part_00